MNFSHHQPTKIVINKKCPRFARIYGRSKNQTLRPLLCSTGGDDDDDDNDHKYYFRLYFVGFSVFDAKKLCLAMSIYVGFV